VRDKFNMTPYQASLLFIIDGAVYALVSPLIGFLLDRCLDPVLCVLGGTFTIGLGYLLMGPLPPFLMAACLPQVCVGVALIGLGMSACFMGTLTIMTREEEKGKSTEKMAGMITSLWITCESLGSFLGALGGGASFDRLGWKYSCLMVAFILMLGVLVIIAFKISQNCKEMLKRASSRVSKDNSRKGLLAGKTNPGYGACQGNKDCVINV